MSEENVGSVKCCERMLEKDADNFSDHKYGIHNFWTFFKLILLELSKNITNEKFIILTFIPHFE